MCCTQSFILRLETLLKDFPGTRYWVLKTGEAFDNSDVAILGNF